MFKKFDPRLKKASLFMLSFAQLIALSMAEPQIPVKAETTQSVTQNAAKRQMENLDRGLVAVKSDDGVYLGWRMLGTEPEDIKFNIYRDGKKINSEPIAASTNYIDKDGSSASTYYVRAILNGKEQQASEITKVWDTNYLSVPIQKPADGVTPKGDAYTYNANDASAADVDGDGKYEIILKWDPSNSQDNSKSGYTGNVFIDAYELDGTRLWRIDLGRNIRAGAHYTQFMAYDLDGDGKAEVACKTADGAVDSTGKIIGDANADYRNSSGYVLSGPEYLTIFDGQTGKELVTTDYDPPRGKVSDWGDSYGNRVDRFLAGVAYLDGERPSLIMARGYYTRAVLVAYNFRDGKLEKLWKFDSNDPDSPENLAYRGQGNHNLSVADVDADGKDEIIYGACAIDDDGTGLYSTGLGHGDAMHLGDLDPNRPGMELFQVHEDKKSKYGLEYRDPATGETIWGLYTGKDTGRGMSADIDPRYEGEEVWAIDGAWNSPTGWLYSAKGELISNNIPAANYGIWWDGDLQREILDHNWVDYTNPPTPSPGTISKWDYINNKSVNILTAEGTSSNNGTKGNPCLQADLFGDWREEVIWRTNDSSALRIYTTTDVTEHKIYTLMHDPVYRLGIAWQNVAYNQPPHTSFYLGGGMGKVPTPNIYLTIVASADAAPGTLNLKSNGGANSLQTYIEFPGVADVSQIDLASVKMLVNRTEVSAQTAPAGLGDYDKDGIQDFMVKFDRKKIVDALQGEKGDVSLVISGYLKDGSVFKGETTIRVIH
jgi:hypothetical protein